MDDYISRQALIEDIKTEILNLSMDGMKGTHRPHDELYGFIERIEEQPSADVRPVVLSQMAILETEMVAMDQIMLPYMVDDQGHTVYELYQSRQLLIGE